MGGMNVDSLAKILKMCGPNDSLKLRWRAGADTVSFQCESCDDDRIADFDLKLMQIESEHMEIPEQHYKVSARLPSAEFQKICRDLKEFGETMQVKASKEGITFSVHGDVGSGNVMLKPREAGKPEDKVSLTVHEPVTATFALRYLVNFAKAAPLCGSVELVWGLMHPCLSSMSWRRTRMGTCSSTWHPRSMSKMCMQSFLCMCNHGASSIGERV